MKFLKKLFVADQERKSVSESVVLDLSAPGRAVFVMQAESAAVGDLVRFYLGENGEMELWFSGYIESVRKIDTRQIRMLVREYSALLSRRWTLAQRHTTARRVLAELSAQTGIAFRLGKESEWAEQPIPYFFNIGTGYEILDLIGKHLQIEDFIWQNQPDGSVYVGSASELAGAGITLGIPARFFTGLSASGADCTCLPALRPGRKIQIGDLAPARIETITLTGEKMRLKFQC